MALHTFSNAIAQSKRPLVTTALIFAALALAFVPGLAIAFQSAGVGDAQTKVCDFFSNTSTILNAASVVVVTVAVIFAGYQIAFAHKRIGDVAPALIGGVIIGAAAQIAKLVVNNKDSGSCGTAMIMDGVNGALHVLQSYA